MVETKVVLKPGQKVTIKPNTIPSKYAGTTQEILAINTEFFREEIGYLMVGLPKTEGDTTNIWKESELELKEDTMNLKKALKTCLDGYKITCDEWMKPYCQYRYVSFVESLGKFYYEGDSDTVFDPTCWTNERFRIYTEPKAQPKFTIGSTVVYRSNRLAKVIWVSSCEPYEYTLANPNNPNSVFKKLESELKEAK